MMSRRSSNQIEEGYGQTVNNAANAAAVLHAGRKKRSGKINDGG
jgi:hypothetical protein